MRNNGRRNFELFVGIMRYSLFRLSHFIDLHLRESRSSCIIHTIFNIFNTGLQIFVILAMSFALIFLFHP